MSTMIKITRPVATLPRSFRIGDGEWDRWNETKVCTMNTTIKELYQWIKQRTGFSGPHCAEIVLTFAEISEATKNE